MRFAPHPHTEICLLAMAQEELPVRVRRSPRARRMILRLDGASGEPILTLPQAVPLAAGEAFLQRHRAWLERRMRERPEAIPFAAGEVIPLRGEGRRIVAMPGRGLPRAALQEDERVILVPGDPRHLARRLTDWLRREARRDLEAASHRYAERLGVRFGRLALRDTTSRWGSCSSRGTLSFSWRLILAPSPVLDYVAAHEVAHLKEMNHSQRFWRLVRELEPGCEEARLWLKENGAGLHRLGRG
ncbi:M48 family metallopeptidase [Afifella pfennigii]|uniref:M48 family metallopeptidase n=1 Tax=Afifella pfennigii TaxID=209897 RepID=UPI00047BA97C|nr:SprT family zinc-dependent metalloprotease [Afifella pfennigii]